MIASTFKIIFGKQSLSLWILFQIRHFWKTIQPTFQQGTEGQPWRTGRRPFAWTFRCLFQLFLQPWWCLVRYGSGRHWLTTNTVLFSNRASSTTGHQAPGAADQSGAASQSGSANERARSIISAGWRRQGSLVVTVSASPRLYLPPHTRTPATTLIILHYTYTKWREQQIYELQVKCNV